MYRFIYIFLLVFTTNHSTHAQVMSSDSAALMTSVKENNLSLTEYLLDKGGNVNLQDGEGLALLHLAAKQDFADMLSLLIRNGANKDISSHYGNTPLELAVFTGSEKCAYLLINSGANINSHGSKDGGTPIQYAVIKTQPALFMHLLRKGADLTIQNNAGYTIFHQIANHENFPEALQTELNLVYNRSKYDNLSGTDFIEPSAIFDTLVNRGAGLFTRDTMGYRPLHLACKRNNNRLIDYLLKNKDNLDDQENVRKETPLLCAIRNKHEGLALKLIRKGADIYLSEKDNWTVLHYAARDGFEKATLEILKRKPDIHAQMNMGWTALHLAAWNYQTEVVNLLLLYGASDSIFNEDGQKPSDLARKKGLDELARQIASKQVNLVELYYAGLDSLVIEKIKSDPNPDLTVTDSKKRTLLHAAAARFNGPFIKWLLQRGANPNTQDAEGRTALMAAYEDINYSLYISNLHVLVQKTNLNLENNDGNTVLHLAAGKDDSDLLQIILKSGANPNQPNKNRLTPFEEACAKSKNPDFLKLLVNAGATINPKTGDHFSPLMLALEQKNFSTSLFLINRGADINFKTHNHLTPLHIIAAKGFGKFLPIALRKEAIINIQTTDSLFSPLHFAAENGRNDIVKLLTWYGANLQSKTILGLTALDMATYEGHEDVKQFLTNPTFNALEMVEYGEEDQLAKLIREGRISDIHQKNDKGESLLHLAVLADSKGLAESLLAKGFNINEQDLAGNTPLLFALKTCNTGFASWLLQKSAHPKMPDLRGETPYSVSLRRYYHDLMMQLKMAKADSLNEIKKDPALIFPIVTAGEIFVARYSPDGKTMLSAGENNLVLWDAKTTRIIKVFENVSKSIADLAFSPDGKLAATVEGRRFTIHSGGFDNNWKHIALWDLQTCRFIKKIELKDGYFTRSVQFSEDGKKLLIAGARGGIQVYEPSTGRVLIQIGNRDEDYANAEWLPGNGGILAATGQKLEWWDADNSQLKKQHLFSNEINKVLVGNDGRFTVVGHKKGMLLFDLKNWKIVREFNCNNEEVNDLAISANNKYLAASIGFWIKNMVRVFSLDSIQPINEYINHKNQVTSLCFSPDGKSILGTDAKNQILEWPVKRSRELFVEDENGKILALSADEQFLFSGESYQPLCKRSAKDLTLLETYDIIDTDLLSMSLNTATDRCFMVSSLGIVLDYNLRKRKYNQRIEMEDFKIIETFPIHDSLLILVSGKGEIAYWNLVERKIIRRWGINDSATIIHAKLSTDKKRIAMGGNLIRIANLDSFKTTTYPDLKFSSLNLVSEISFLADPRFILASILDKGLGVISLEDGTMLKLMEIEDFHLTHEMLESSEYAISSGFGKGSKFAYSMIDLTTGEIPDITTIGDDFGRKIALSSDSILFISTDRGIYKKRPDPEQVSRTFNLSPSNLKITGLSPNAAFIMVSQDSVNYSIDLGSFKKEKMFMEGGTDYKKVNTIGENNEVEIYTKQEGIQYWNAKIAKVTGRVEGTKYPLSTSVMSSDGSLVVTGDFSATIRIKNLANDSLIRLISMDQIPVSLALSADKKFLFAASTNYQDVILGKPKIKQNQLSVWSVETGKMLKQLDTFLTPLPTIKLLPKSEMLISFERTDDNNLSLLKIYHLSKDRITTIMRTDGSVNSIAISQNEKKMLINMSSGKAVLYDLNSLKESVIHAHEAPLIASAFSPDDRFIYTTAKDNTVKIWDATNAKLITTIYFASDTTRMIIGPDNYYACSKEIIKDFGWQMDNRRFEFDQFDLAYNRPDIAYRHLPNADTSELPLYNKAWKKRLEKMNYSEAMLSGEFHVPEISITNREMLPYKSAAGNVILQIAAKDTKYPLNRLNAWVNGVPLYGVRGMIIQSSAGKNANHRIPIKLSHGKNKIEVSVTNEKGTESLKETLIIQYNASEKRKPDLYLVTIGASEYKDSTMNLLYAAKDAKDISNLFTKFNELYNLVHLFPLLNRDVTKENIAKIKDSLLISHPDDVVFIFYAGHGLPDKNLDYFLASWSTDFDDPAKNGIPYDMLENLLDSIPSRKKLMLLDACFSGEIDKTAEILIDGEASTDGQVNFRAVGNIRGIGIRNPARSKEVFEFMKQHFADLRRSTGTLVISSAGSGEFAFEGDSWENGVFTYCLLDGLITGKADVFPTNTGITANEMNAYLMERVKVLTRGRQTPTNRREKVEFDFRIW